MITNEQNEETKVVSEVKSSEVNVTTNTTTEIENESKSDNDLTKEKMLEMYEETFTNFKPGQIVEGTVVSITDSEVLVDIGFKSEGSIPLQEFANTGIPEKLSKVNVFIGSIEDGEGKVKLSKKRADFFLNIEKLKELYKSNETIIGILRRRVKGGMIAEIMGLEAFLPGSQISLKPIPNLDQFIGKESEFKIIKLDQERRNIIVSRKKVLEEQQSQRKELLREKIQLEAELDGEVKNITDYGAFIDLGGLDGLLHITDMSWGRINHPSEMLNIGDKLKVKVIGFDEENERVSLGLKQLVPHPWENIEAKYPEGSKVSGKVVNITNYGAFVELEVGVEGLVHVSEMSWTKKISHPNQMLKVGDSVTAIVLAVSKDNQRISLGMKQMDPNPWLTIDERYPSGMQIVRKIKNITPFGVFVEIEDDIDGLVHISDISWTKRIYHPKEVFKKGQEITAIVLSIDKALHRIALGVKQLNDDPWKELGQRLPVNTEISGKISKLIPKGVLVDVPIDDEFVEGFVPVSHLGIPKLNNLELIFELNEELPLKVIELDTENRRLILSVKAYFFGKDKEQLMNYIDVHEAKMFQQEEEAIETETIETEVVESEKVEEKETEEVVTDTVEPVLETTNTEE